MLELLIDNIYFSSSNSTFFNKALLGIPMEINDAPLLSNFFYAPMSLRLYKNLSKTGILMMFYQLIIRTLLTGCH